MQIYHKQYVPGFGFKSDSNEDEGTSPVSITDPVNLASYLFTNIKLVEEMAEEIRENLGEAADELIEAQLQEGFKGIESEGVSFVIDKFSKFNILIALFYDSDTFDRKIAEKLANKIIEIFAHKYEKKLEKDIVARNYKSFDWVLTTIYEDTISDMVKRLFLNLGSQNVIIPWLFLVHTSDIDINLQPEATSPGGEKKKHSFNSTHFSKNPGLSNIGKNQESDPEIEFAYNSDEDSVFSAFNGNYEKNSYHKKMFDTVSQKYNKEIQRRSEGILKELEIKNNVLKMLYNFDIDLEDSEIEEHKLDKSQYSVEEEKSKKDQLKNDFVEFKNSRHFRNEPDKEKIMKELFKVAVSANSIMKICGEKQEFNSIEMTLNIKNMMLDKSKLLIVKVNSLILMIPIKVSRIEVKLRNTFFINEQPALSSLAMFVEFYLRTFVNKGDE
ncbi:unnamed protein product [Moneuplotes crassus]|uniref:Uncharacterized protein n=2 Tax=Euplotes crassus TaxID=5936 RepID=A0AAD1UL34_EUPCR|nr:unnamed protein product [Moneuplotes crassus]